MKEHEYIAAGLQQLNRRAVQEASRGEYQTALRLFQQILGFEEQLGFHGHAAETLLNIATTSLLARDEVAALAAATRAEASFTDQRRTEDARRTAILIGTILLVQRRYGEAVQTLEKCLRLTPTPVERAAIYLQAAGALVQLRQHYRAQQYLGRSLAEYQRLGDNHGVSSCLKQRAALFSLTGQNSLAAQDLLRCQALEGRC